MKKKSVTTGFVQYLIEHNLTPKEGIDKLIFEHDTIPSILHRLGLKSPSFPRSTQNQFKELAMMTGVATYDKRTKTWKRIEVHTDETA